MSAVTSYCKMRRYAPAGFVRAAPVIGYLRFDEIYVPLVDVKVPADPVKLAVGLLKLYNLVANKIAAPSEIGVPSFKTSLYWRSCPSKCRTLESSLILEKTTATASFKRVLRSANPLPSTIRPVHPSPPFVLHFEVRPFHEDRVVVSINALFTALPLAGPAFIEFLVQRGVIGREIAVAYAKSQQLRRQEEDRETRRFVLSLASESDATKARATEVAREFLNLDDDRVVELGRAMNMPGVEY